MPGKNLTHTCVDCKDKEAVTTARTRSLCPDCFQKFLTNKFLRRIEIFRKDRDRDAPLKVLLPLSFGTSSSVLLHMWDSNIRRKLSRNSEQFLEKLHVLVIEPSTIDSAVPVCNDRFALVQQSFPQHQFSKVSFHDIFELDSRITETIRSFPGADFVNDDSYSNRDRLQAFRSSISSTTSRDDLDTILLTRLVVACAHKFGCEGVAWGDCDSRLAAKVLANVAKGRGSSLTWQVCDGMSPWNLHFGFPLRDIYKPELEIYAAQMPTLSKIILPQSPLSENVPSRNLSIDKLMTQYIQTQGEKYRGVMANIVRTVDKLQPVPIRLDTPCCNMCGAPLGTQDLEGTVYSGFCYGCTRSAPERTLQREG